MAISERKRIHKTESLSTLALMAWSETMLYSSGKGDDLTALEIIIGHICKNNEIGSSPDVRSLEPAERAVFRRACAAYLKSDVTSTPDMDNEINRILLKASLLLAIVNKKRGQHNSELASEARTVSDYFYRVLGVINDRGRSGDFCVDVEYVR